MSSTIAFDIIARDRASDKFDKVGDSAKRSGDKLKKFAKIGGAALGAGAIVAGKFAIDAVGAASDVEQAYGALETVYGSNAKQVKKWAEGAAMSVGLAKGEYANLSALVGSQLQGMGVATDDSAKKSKDLIKMGADLAATYGGTVKEAVEAVSSTLKGETDPIERYGVSIKQSDISARMAADGLEGLEGKAKKQATAQTVLTLLTEQTGKAQGAFGRESDTLAGKQERLKATFENTKAAIGEKLLPIATKMADWMLTKGVPAAQKFGDWFQQKIMPPLRDFAEDAAPKARQIMDTLKNAFDDAKPFIELAGTVLTNVVVPGLKKLTEIAGNALVGKIKAIGKALEFMGNMGKWMWNNVLQPVFKFILNGVADILDGWSTMLGAMGKVPGFGWAKKAAEDMENAGAKARAMAEGIKKIPSSKSVTITTTYVTRNAGKEKSMGRDWENPLGRGKMRATIQSTTADFFEALSDGIKKGGKKLDKVLDASRTRLKDKLGGIRDEMKSMGESIASALNQVDFSGSLSEHLASLTGTNGALAGLTSVFESLKNSVSKGYLSSLMQSGNIGLATALANDPAAAAQASALYDSNAAMAQGLGDQTAQQVLGDQITAALEKEIAKMLKELKDAPGKHARELRKEIEKIKLEVKGLSAGRQAYLRGAGG
jgi:hypothetical protein